MDHAAKLADALRKLLKNFPTDTDLIEAEWDWMDVDAAMEAHEDARNALAEYERHL